MKKLTANHTMRAENSARERAVDDLETFMRSESERLRASRKADEAKRISDVQTEKQKAAKSKISIAIMTTDGRQHTVRRIMTTSDRLAKERRLPDDLKACVDAFALLVGDAVGAATRDSDDSTARLSISYDGHGGMPMFGSKPLTDRQAIDCRRRRRPPACKWKVGCQTAAGATERSGFKRECAAAGLATPARLGRHR